MMSFLVKLFPPLSASLDPIDASMTPAGFEVGCCKVSFW